MSIKSAKKERVLAMQALYQLDVRGAADAEAVFETLSDDAASHGLEPESVQRAMDVARAAHASHTAADTDLSELAPAWPAHRQPPVDRSIFRLAHYEMTSGSTSPKVAVNEAIELAKAYGSERSPAFLNGVLDKVLKRVRSDQPAEQAVPAKDPQPEQE